MGREQLVLCDDSEFDDFSAFRKRGAKKVSFKDRARKARRAEAKEIERQEVEELNNDDMVRSRKW